jgi:hypothetical protein
LNGRLKTGPKKFSPKRPHNAKEQQPNAAALFGLNTFAFSTPGGPGEVSL